MGDSDKIKRLATRLFKLIDAGSIHLSPMWINDLFGLVGHSKSTVWMIKDCCEALMNNPDDPEVKGSANVQIIARWLSDNPKKRIEYIDEALGDFNGEPSNATELLMQAIYLEKHYMVADIKEFFEELVE